MSKKALDGLKVVGFTYAGVGNMVIKYLVEYGATAIRVESMKRLDNTRVSAPYKDNVFGINRSGYYAWINNDRYCMALNLKHPRAMEVCEQLIKWADVLVENFAPGTMERSNLGYNDVKKINPGITMISCSQQGQTGPHRQMPGYGGTLQALAGFTNLTGWPDRWPVQVDRSYPDFIAPRFGVVAVIAALDYRERTGKGQYIDISEYEDSIHFLAPVILDYTANRNIQGRAGNRCAYAAPHGCYRCKGDDKWCVISVFTDGDWSAFCKAIGNPGWANEPRFKTLLGRKQNEEELDRLVEEWTINYSAEEVMNMMQAAGVAAGVLQTLEDLAEYDPQLKYLHFYWELDHPEVGKHHVAAPPFVLSKSPCELRRAPLLGEHNEYVFKEILGLSDEEVAELVIEGVIE